MPKGCLGPVLAPIRRPRAARLMRLLVLTGIVSVMLASLASAQPKAERRDLVAGAEKRVALVVGMSRYQFITALDNPKNDARLIANTLKGLGFSLVGGGAQFDLDKPAFDRAVQSFGQQVAGADVALFYYAGHGLQVRGTNWLVPITANPSREADVDFQMVDASLVLRQMESAGTRLNLMILDACRNNPFGGRGLRATAGGLAQMQAPEGTLISYATQPGNVAADGNDGNSPFTKALAQTMSRPGLDVFKLFNEVGLQVKRTTGGAQQPWVSNSPIDGDFYFVGVPAGSTVTVQTPNVLRPTAPAPSAEAELLFWQSIANSTDPADFDEYVAKYPDGRFSGLAQRRGAALAAASAKPSPAALVPAPQQAALPAGGQQSIGRVTENYPEYGYLVFQTTSNIQPGGAVMVRSTSGEMLQLRVEKRRGDQVSATGTFAKGSVTVGAEVLAAGRP